MDTRYTLRAKDLEKSFKGRKIVRKVSVSVRSGEVVGLLGPNGAGKTTCFCMILGITFPDNGDVFINEKKITKDPLYKRSLSGISYLPQEASIFRKLTVSQNIEAILELRSNKLNSEETKKSNIKEKRDKLMEDLQITSIKDNLGRTLSGGERRRVEIARSLATNPSFLLLDEPFAGVDPIAVIEIQRIIRFLKDSSIGVLITDHNVRETLGICDKATIMNDGTVLANGSPNQIIDDETVRKTYLGENFKL
ncbi:MAG: LPS export ABC transporter ATP-binding protein [Proteobacteria bacterium]|jgi:lipopolysaccharide export system ATP-binding protein|nr:LPS export ABC transporter ATP-binding protein [Pseudomonadota bacterium]